MNGQQPTAKEVFEKALEDPGISDPQSDQAYRTGEQSMRELPDLEAGG